MMDRHFTTMLAPGRDGLAGRSTTRAIGWRREGSEDWDHESLQLPHADGYIAIVQRHGDDLTRQANVMRNARSRGGTSATRQRHRPCTASPLLDDSSDDCHGVAITCAREALLREDVERMLMVGGGNVAPPPWSGGGDGSESSPAALPLIELGLTVRRERGRRKRQLTEG